MTVPWQPMVAGGGVNHFPRATNTGVSMQSLRDGARAVVFGASGGLGGAFVRALAAEERIAVVDAFARSAMASTGKIRAHELDLLDAEAVAAAAHKIGAEGPLDLVLVATGLLHDEAAGIAPEKSWRQLDAERLLASFRVNAVGPALVAKHFLPMLARDRKAIFAALSARVGSIEDNRVGGWYAYRSSKAALNQLLRTASVELARRWPKAVCVGLHPGTVDTRLSAPFQGNVPAGKLFAADDAAERLLAVLDGLGPRDSGGLYAWDGERVPF